MKLLVAIYFFILAIIELGLWSGIYHYYRTQNTIRPSSYWMWSLSISVIALFLFGTNILAVEDISKPAFNFTIANTLFYIAAILQLLFCYSLNRTISRNAKIVCAFSVIIFFFFFDYLRQESTFEIRTAFMCILVCIFFPWQIMAVNKKMRVSRSNQLLYLQVATSGEILFALGRLIIVILSSFTIRNIDQIPQILILFTIAQFVMNTLSYIAIGGYWAEQIAIANIQSTSENLEIKALLAEREALIGSLLKANKTASTGALSASIAHELNQPLGATNLNIQFLQKKLADGNLSPVIEKEVLDTLLIDNQRAANIIRSLRSIFSDEGVNVSKLDFADLISRVLDITKPEIATKNIQIALRLERNLLASVNSGEVQQVLLNLINNAIQALAASQQAKKTLVIEGHNIANGIQISVADNGYGIPFDAQSRLFELLSGSKSSGMGLGLWLCKHIVTRHGGIIWYEDNPGGGAKFLFELPHESILSNKV